MKIRRYSLLAVLSLTAMLGSVKATTLGYDTDPLGARDGINVGYSLWDVFPGTTSNFTYTNPGESIGGGPTGIFSGALKSDTSGGILLGSNDRMYQNQNPFSFTIQGGTGTGASAIVLQLKFTSPSVGDPAAFFNLALNNTIAPTSVALFGTSVEGANTFNIVTYTWTGLNIPSGGQIKFTIGSAAEHVSLDGMAVDVQAVPEPATWMTLAAGLGFLTLVARRRFARS
jgi:hypothetical protein